MQEGPVQPGLSCSALTAGLPAHPHPLGTHTPSLLLPKGWGRGDRGLADIICCPSKQPRLMGKATAFPAYQNTHPAPCL